MRWAPRLGCWLALLAGSAAAAADEGWQVGRWQVGRWQVGRWQVGRWGRDAVPCGAEAYSFEAEGTFQRVRDGIRVDGEHFRRGDELVLTFHDGHLYRWRVVEQGADRLRFVDPAGKPVELRRCP